MEDIGFVKYPKDIEEVNLDNPDRLIIVGAEIYNHTDVYTAAALSNTMRTIKESDEIDPLKAIDSIIQSTKAGVYPPIEYLKWLSDCFEEYQELWGTSETMEGATKARPLEKIMGIRKGPGQSDLFKKDAEKVRNEMLCNYVHILVKHFNQSIANAAEIVCQKLQETPRWNKTGLTLAEVGPDAIRKYYSKEYKPKYEGLLAIKPMTSEEKEAFLNTFPLIAKNLIK